MIRRSRRQRGGYDSAELAGAQTAYDQAKTALIAALESEIATLQASKEPDTSIINTLNERLDELKPKSADEPQDGEPQDDEPQDGEPQDGVKPPGGGGRIRRKSRRTRRTRRSRRSRRSRHTRQSRRSRRRH